MAQGLAANSCLKRVVVVARSQGGTVGGRSPPRSRAAAARLPLARAAGKMGRKNVNAAAEPAGARAALGDFASTSAAARQGDEYFAKDKRPIM